MAVEFVLFLFLLLTWSSICEDAKSPKATASPAENQLQNWAATHSTKYVPNATTNEGIPIPSLTASLTVGARGPILLQDSFLLEIMANFNRERIPERVVHAKGAGAQGYFEVTHDISHLTKAKFLNRISKKTKVAVRFSTVGGELGSADSAVDPKGFAVKFYTEEGIHDLVANNLEVFQIRDPILFHQLIRSRKRNPRTHLKDPSSWWDFTSLRPESALNTLHLFSYKGTPNGYRVMDGGGVHTFKMVNKDDKAVYVKFHLLTNQPKKHLTRQESAELRGTNPDYAIQDLFDAIETKQFPSWNLSIQVMTFDEAAKHSQNPFDPTKHWRREEYPLITVGKMTLDRNPENFFIDVEQIAFSPSNMVPGIEPSPDRLLHGRMFSYPDAARYRLGVNFAQLPINKCPFAVHTYTRDGFMQYGPNGKGGPNYFPNSFRGVKQNLSPAIASSIYFESGDVDRIDMDDDDNFTLPRIYLKKDVDSREKKRIVEDIADFLGKAKPFIQQRYLKNTAYPISKEFGDMIKNELKKVKLRRQGRKGLK